MTSEEFIINVKTKSGDQRMRDGRLIRDVDDRELMRKMLERYPGERDNIDDLDTYLEDEDLPPEPPKSEVQSRLDNAKKGFFARIGDRFNERAEAGGDALVADQNILSKGLQTLGQGAGFVGDIGMEALKTVTPDFIEEGIKSGAQALGETAPVQYVAEKYNDFSEAHPEAAGNIEAIGNIAGLVPAAKIGNVGAKGVVKGAEKGLDVAKQGKEVIEDAFAPTQEALEKRIKDSFDRAVKPSIAGKGTNAQLQDYSAKELEAVKTIKDNKSNLKYVDDSGEIIESQNPESLKQFTEAIEQTKSKIFNDYDALAKKAGDAGAKVDLVTISDELNKVANNPTIADLNPQVAKYAQTRAEALNKRGTYTATEAQDAVKSLNASLEAFYKNPSYESASKAGIDALIVNNLRKSLDESITKLTESGYQDLKKKYGSLRAIENDVVKATLRDARKNQKGLIDFTDVFSGGQLVSGILSLNPALIGSSLAQKGIASYIKFLNNPNRAIKKLFQDADKLEGSETQIGIAE